MDNVERSVIKENGKVFMITKTKKDLTKDNREIFEESIVKTQVTNEVLDDYVIDMKTQNIGYKKQEKENETKLKSLLKDYNKYSNERGFVSYKKNFDKYETFEKFIEGGFKDGLLNDKVLKELNKYKKNRDSYKNYFVTINQEVQIKFCEDNKKAFKDIWSEVKMLENQIKEARKLL